MAIEESSIEAARWMARRALGPDAEAVQIRQADGRYRLHAVSPVEVLPLPLSRPGPLSGLLIVETSGRVVGYALEVLGGE